MTGRNGGEEQLMTRDDVARWVVGYERAWRSPGTKMLADLFAVNVSYAPSPWAEPIRGLEHLGRFWEAERQGSDEPFAMTNEIVAIDPPLAVVRVAVDYGSRGESGDRRWRDLWVIRFNGDGRCAAFEEWPFTPGQPDGHDA
jgi:hypothetical protein